VSDVAALAETPSPSVANVATARSPIQVPSCGRILHLWSDRWDGPRPAVVIKSRIEEDRVFVDCNVSFHGVEDASLLHAARLVASGNTLAGVELLQPPRPAGFGDLDAAIHSADICNNEAFGRVVAVWPPRT